MERGVSLYIDPSGAQTGGRVVKRELKEIGDSAITTQQRIDQLTRAQEQMAKSAQTSAQAIVQQQDALRAKFNPTFAVIQRFKQVQDEIRTAHRLGAISANEMATALSRERQASLLAMAAIKGHTNAVVADNAAMRNAILYRTQLLYQINDVVVSLISGMNPAVVFAQQGAQVVQLQGGLKRALSETADMAGSVVTRFGRIGVAATIAGSVAGLAFSHIRSEASKAIGETVSYGEVIKATFQTIWDSLRSTFGPTVATLLDPLFYAFGKLQSAAVDIAEMIVNAFRAAYHDVAFVWDQFPNMIGAAFVGGVNIAIEHLNKLAKASADTVDTIIDAFNKIPGVDVPKINSDGNAIDPIRNKYAEALARANEQAKSEIEAIKKSQPIRDLGSSIVDRVQRNRAQSRLSDLGNMDFSASIQGANQLGQAVGGVATAAQQASSTVIDVNQQMMDARRQTLATFEQQGKQLRAMKSDLKDIQETLAAAAKTPVSDVFGDRVGQGAAGAIDAAASSIQKVFAALNDGRVTAQTAHEALELIRASLHQLGGDRSKVDAWVDSVINAQFQVGALESGVKSLSASIAGIPNRTISIGIQQYTVPSSGGGTKGVNVFGGGAPDMTYQQFDVGGGKTVGVSSGQGYSNPARPDRRYLYTDDEVQGMYQTLGYGVDQSISMQQDAHRYGMAVNGVRAAGGPVSAVGTYLVGENGPEILKMQGGGQVTNANSTAAILSGGRDVLSLIEDHLYNVVQELRIHTNYFETFESDYSDMIACLKKMESYGGGSSSYSGGGSSTSSGGRSYGGSSGSSDSGQSHLDPHSPYYFNAARNFAGRGGAKYDPVADAMMNGNVDALRGVGNGSSNYLRQLEIGGFGAGPSLLDRLKRQLGVGFATGGQIMPGEDQRVEFFKKNSERVIIVDDKKVSDSRGGGTAPAKGERPISLTVNFQGGNASDPRSRQAMADDFVRAVKQAGRM